jgi:hypothetical protein
MTTLLLLGLGWAAFVYTVLAVTGNITWPHGAVVKYDPVARRARDPRAGMAVSYVSEVADRPNHHRFRYEFGDAVHEFESAPSRFQELYELCATVETRLSRSEQGAQRALEIDPGFLDLSGLPEWKQAFLRKLFVRLIKEVLPPGADWKTVSVDLLSPEKNVQSFPSHAVKRFRRRKSPASDRPSFKPVPGQIVLTGSEVRDLRRALKGPLLPIEFDAAAKRAYDPATGIAIRHSRHGYPREGDDYYMFEFAGRSAEFDGGVGYDAKLRAATEHLETLTRFKAGGYRRHRKHRIVTNFLAVRLLPHDVIPALLDRIADVFRVCAGREGSTVWVSLYGDFPQRLHHMEEEPDVDAADLEAWLERNLAEEAKELR